MTVIYRKMDLQTRQMEPINGSTSSGGIKNDANILTMYFEAPDEVKNFAKKLIVFDVLDDDKKNISIPLVKEENSEYFRCKVPFNVMKRVEKNKLSYQLVFVDGNLDENGVLAQSEVETIVLSNQDTLFVGRSLIDSILSDL